MTQEIASLESLALTLHDIGAVQFGRFILHSGKSSPIYMDLRVLISYPAALRLVARMYAGILQELHFDRLAAIPYAGLPIGVAISLEMDRPLIYPRKEVKSYGTGQQIEGQFNVGDRAVVVEDLVTSGKSVIQGGALLKGAGLQISDAVVLIDRLQGGGANLQAEGYTLHSVVTLPYLLRVLEEQERITARQHARVLEALY
jgi:uridine monophosphate synthetase